MSGLYSPRLAERYAASLEAGDLALQRRWPAGCGGAGNAFLVLLGPSPGGSRSKRAERAGDSSQAPPRPMRIGPHAMNFDWGDHRKTRWTHLCAQMLGDPRYVQTLTALVNLTADASTDERTADRGSLPGGWQELLPVLGLVKPRRVCALTNRVWKVVRESAEQASVNLPPVSPSELARADGIPAAWMSLVTLLVKPHNHPLRFLTNAQAADLGRVCQWFLDLDAEAPSLPAPASFS